MLPDTPTLATLIRDHATQHPYTYDPFNRLTTRRLGTVDGFTRVEITDLDTTRTTTYINGTLDDADTVWADNSHGLTVQQWIDNWAWATTQPIDPPTEHLGPTQARNWVKQAI